MNLSVKEFYMLTPVTNQTSLSFLFTILSAFLKFFNSTYAYRVDV